MSSAVFPSLPGEMFPVSRAPVFDTIVQQSISGKETRIANQNAPRYRYELSFSILRSAAFYAEFQQLLGFVNQRQGKFDSFLYPDSDDFSVVNQQIGLGDGSTKAFQLVRTFGGFTEPVLAPNGGASVYLNGVLQTSGVAVSVWGSATPGVVTFTTAPGSGVAITVNMNYYWPCRFDMDSFTFGQFLNQYYELKKLSFMTIK